jgi:sec-independent protein translocase protein TatC
MDAAAHLNELRRAVIIAAVSIFVCSAAMLMPSGKILSGFANLDGYTFVYTSPEMIAAQQLKIAVICGIIISLPISAGAVWRFVSPALTRSERRGCAAVLAFGVILFACGAVFAYSVIFPIMIRFFKSIECVGIEAYISIAEYVNFMITVCAIFGIAFELPIVMVCLERAKIVPKHFFEGARKYAVAAIFTAAALVTPSDVFSMIVTALPILGIYEIGIIAIRVMRPKKL